MVPFESLDKVPCSYSHIFNSHFDTIHDVTDIALRHFLSWTYA